MNKKKCWSYFYKKYQLSASLAYYRSISSEAALVTFIASWKSWKDITLEVKTKTYHEDFEFVILDYFIESGLIFDNNLFGQHVARHQSDPKNDGQNGKNGQTSQNRRAFSPITSTTLCIVGGNCALDSGFFCWHDIIQGFRSGSWPRS